MTPTQRWLLHFSLHDTKLRAVELLDRFDPDTEGGVLYRQHVGDAVNALILELNELVPLLGELQNELDT